MTYPGGKGGSGVYQTIINQMPRHLVYVEAFLGGGAVMRLKKPAPIANIGIDVDTAALEGFPADSFVDLREGNALEFLRDISTLAALYNVRQEDILVYCDPPYLMETRGSQRQIYRYELGDEESHAALLGLLLDLRCMVMISGYDSSLYNSMLATWRRVEYKAMTRGGRQADEVIWCNFPEPFELHDYRYLGRGFRERERIKRKKARWKKKLSGMAMLERAAILEALEELRSSASSEVAVFDEVTR